MSAEQAGEIIDILHVMRWQLLVVIFLISGIAGMMLGGRK